jgi:hypothetical protein
MPVMLFRFCYARVDYRRHARARVLVKVMSDMFDMHSGQTAARAAGRKTAVIQREMPYEISGWSAEPERDDFWPPTPTPSGGWLVVSQVIADGDRGRPLERLARASGKAAGALNRRGPSPHHAHWAETLSAAARAILTA